MSLVRSINIKGSNSNDIASYSADITNSIDSFYNELDMLGEARRPYDEDIVSTYGTPKLLNDSEILFNKKKMEELS